jgi:hypothetical protein
VSFVIDECHAGNRPPRSDAEARQFVDDGPARSGSSHLPRALGTPIEQTKSGHELDLGPGLLVVPTDGTEPPLELVPREGASRLQTAGDRRAGG